MNRERIHCNYCKSTTWHNEVVSYSHEHFDNLFGFEQKFYSSTFICCGCEDVTFRVIKHPFTFQNDDDAPIEVIYPDRDYKFRDRRIYFNLPKHIHNIYNETITAHNNKLIVLSAVGVRALVEAIVEDKIDKSKFKNNLESKIDSLNPHFSKSVIDTLHEFRKMGNKAAHELKSPESLNIHQALYVVENMLDFFYAIENHAKLFTDNKK